MPDYFGAISSRRSRAAVPDPAAKTFEARPPRRARPAAPPLDLVAFTALRELDPASPVTGFLRSLPCVGDRMRRIEATRYVEQLAGELGLSEAERLAALRFGLSARTLRRYRRGL